VEEFSTEARQEDALTFVERHRFMVLISGTIVVAIILTIVSMVMYEVSGTAQLDLSRPGYQSVSDQIDTDNQIKDYSAIGPVNTDTVNEFLKLYDEQAKKAKAVDAYSGDPLNPDVLEFSPR